MHRTIIVHGLVLSYFGVMFFLIVVLSHVLGAGFPLFTACWIFCCAGALIVKKDLSVLGLCRVPARRFLSTAGGCLLMICLPVFLIEPFTKSYANIITSILQSPVPDLAFIGLKIDGFTGILFCLTYFACIGLAAEEVFFRGLLIQLFKKRLQFAVIPLQALAFTALNLFILLVASPRDSLIYLGAYTLPLSLALGWAAYRTNSIWPGFCALNVANVGYFVILRNVV